MRLCIPTLGVILLAAALASAADTATIRVRKYAVHELAGDYTRDAGPALRAGLRLRLNGEYEAEWRGCVLNAGCAQGSWRIVGDWIQLTPANEIEPVGGKGSLKGKMRGMRIVPQGDGFALVPQPEEATPQKVDRRSAFLKAEKVEEESTR